jgi:hypothetical protein
MKGGYYVRLGPSRDMHQIREAIKIRGDYIREVLLYTVYGTHAPPT